MSIKLYGKKYKTSFPIDNNLDLLKILENQSGNFEISNCKVFKYTISKGEIEYNLDLELNLINFESDDIKKSNFFLCDSKNLITINFNKKLFKIPSDMSIIEFKDFVFIQSDIFNKYNMEMFSDEYFTNNSQYYTKI